MKRRIAILGSTGSIGKQALDVISRHPELFCAEVLTANSNSTLLIKQAIEHNVNSVVIADESKYQEVFKALDPYGIKVFTGNASVSALACGSNIDMVLTASGGPFLSKTKEEIETATVKEALNHPKWLMGPKVTIDSASMMNKGLEMIEAHWLFGIEPSKIEIVVHPQSIIHSMVQFSDGSVTAQLSIPDMRLPIQYALSFPKRLHSDLPRPDFIEIGQLSFSKPDTSLFRNLDLAFEALRVCGNMPCIMNAANEEAVEAFLNNKINFFDISEVIEKTMITISHSSDPTLQDYVDSDAEARKLAKNLIKKISLK